MAKDNRQHWAKTRIVMVQDGMLSARDGGGPRMVQRYEWKCSCGKTSGKCTFPTKQSAMDAGMTHARAVSKPPIDDDAHTWRPKHNAQDLVTATG